MRDEALRKVGRNIVNLQKMERALKLLIVLSDLKGPISELKVVYEKRLADVEKLTMGRLANKLLHIAVSRLTLGSITPPLWPGSTPLFQLGVAVLKTELGR